VFEPKKLSVGQSPEMSPLHVHWLFLDVLSQTHVITINSSQQAVLSVQSLQAFQPKLLNFLLLQ
jgi:hypothetical protein